MIEPSESSSSPRRRDAISHAHAAAQQTQFLQVVDRDTAERRLHAAIRLEPVGDERVPLSQAWGRVLSQAIVAAVNVPSFDRSNYDGFAVRAEDTFGATELAPRPLQLNSEVLHTAVQPQCVVTPGTATAIATGGMLPRAATAIVMIEHAELQDGTLMVTKAVPAGFGITFAGNDIAHGETVLWPGSVLTSRETGVLAAIGCSQVSVWKRPRVAILSTGDEILAPGESMRAGYVYDSNARILADAVRELGGEPEFHGVFPDHLPRLARALQQAIATADLVILSGGTSKGSGDLSYQAVRELTDPGIVAHGVALKPGKPICLAATQGKAVILLPGFPTSAIFTFHEFAGPVLLRLGGRRPDRRATAQARLPVQIQSEVGRTEYLLVNLVANVDDNRVPYTAYPMGKGSGSVTTFSRADGFLTIDRQQELLLAGSVVPVQLLGPELQPADLVVIGSHCLGLDWLLGELQQQGWNTKFLAVGSTAGLEAVRRGACDLAGIHLLDAASGTYNAPFVTDSMVLLPGYGRQQGLVFRPDDPRLIQLLDPTSPEHTLVARFQQLVSQFATAADPPLMVNRNPGSGTRILIDQLLDGRRPPGYVHQAKSHVAVTTAIAQRRADWGLAIRSAADPAELAFVEVCDEQYDFIVPRRRLDRPAVQAFVHLLQQPATREALARLGLRP